MTFPIRFGARPAVALLLLMFFMAMPAQAADDAARLRAAVAAERARPRAPLLPRTTFLSRPELRAAALSPDGRAVAYLRDRGRDRALWVLPTAGGAPRQVLATTEASALAWSLDGRWLFLETPKQVHAVAYAAGAGSRAIAALGGRSRREFVGVDPVAPAAVLVLERPEVLSSAPQRWRVFRIDAQGRQALLRDETREIVDVAFDPRGRVAFLLRAEGEQHVIHRVDAAGRLHALGRCVRMQRCQFLNTTDEGRELLLRTNVGGNFVRLARLDASGVLHTLHVDPRAEADLEGVTIDPLTQAPLFAHYRSTVAASYGLTPEAVQHLTRLQRQLPGRALRIEVGRGARAHWLVRERADTLRGERVHLYDPCTGNLREVLAELAFQEDGKHLSRPQASVMSRQVAFAYRASDGMRLHGFVLVPPGLDPRTAPLIVSAHGGPFNLVRPEFNNEAQFLANRGYIVFLPNFRGSTGLGRDYLLAARGDFGNGRVQQDIVEGVRYLLAQGIGDRDRVGITGASFGGYTTLLGLTFQPELFKVGVAAVPPADFGWTLREYVGAGAQMVPGVPIAASMRHLSLDPADPAIARRLAAQSPIAHAAQLRRPLLLLAGGEDERVPIRGVTHYAAKLRSLHKDVSLFVEADAGHTTTDARTREAYFYLMELLMHRHLGGAAPLPLDATLRAYVRKNLRLVGRDLQDLARADTRNSKP